METGESLHHASERRAMYTITDAVFGLAIGLGAFSLTEFQITVIQDVYFAIGFFFLTFFFISLFWMWVRRFYEGGYSVLGQGITGILYIMCFLVAILPFIMRLFFSSMYGGSEEIAIFAQTWLYPLDMSVISMLVGALHVLFLKQGKNTVPWAEYKHIGTDGFTAFFVAGGFLLTALAPIDQTLADLVWFLDLSFLPDIPAKLGVWILLIILAIPVYAVMEVALRRMERSYEYQ